MRKKSYKKRIQRATATLILLLVFGDAGLRAEDIDLYRKAGPKNGMVVIDNSRSMDFPVYDHRVDYGKWMKALAAQNLAVDRNSCRNGGDWWDRNGTGNDYDRLEPEGVYLVQTRIRWGIVRDAGPAHAMSEKIVLLSDIMDSPEGEDGAATNPVHPLLVNSIIPARNAKGDIWSLADIASIDVDDGGAVRFPVGISTDMDDRVVPVPEEIRGASLPNGQAVLRGRRAGPGEAGSGFVQALHGAGWYFSGTFRPESGTGAFTAELDALEEVGTATGQGYFFAAGNWLNFIKLIKDFRSDSTDPDASGCVTPSQWDRNVRGSLANGSAAGKFDRQFPGMQDSAVPGIRTRMEVVQDFLEQLFQQTAGAVNWGISVSNDFGSGMVIAPLGTDTGRLIALLKGIRACGTRSIGGAVQAAYNGNLVRLEQDPSGMGCGRNFMLVVSDGFPQRDTVWDSIRGGEKPSLPGPEFGFCRAGYGECPQYGDADVWPEDNYGDDLAHWLHHAASFPHQVHTVAVSSDNPLLAEMADSGGGLYQEVHTISDFSAALVDVARMAVSADSFVAPAVPLSQSDMTQDGEALYAVFFQPDDSVPWSGNLKKYGLEMMTRGEGDCNRNEEELTVVDRNGNPAVDCHGAWKPASVSCWSESSDGGAVTTGGAGERLLESIRQVNFHHNRFYDFRNIYTCINPSESKRLVRFFRDGDGTIADTVSPADLGIEGAGQKENYLARDRIINFMYGYTAEAFDSGGKLYDEERDGRPVGVRDWILGDIIHSRPCVIDYFTTDGTLAYRFVAVGANDGMLHVFVDSVTSSSGETIHIGNREYAPGDEIWAFIPGEFLPRLKELTDGQTHRYFVDGGCSLFRSRPGSTVINSFPGNTGTYDDKVLVFGERRGGRCYWALDVTEPDPARWFVRWRLKGGSGVDDFSPDLGYSWSDPVLTSYADRWSRHRDVAVFCGGYDPEEDFFPESWADNNFDGIYSPESGQDVFDIHNPRHDTWDNDRYDYFNPEQNEVGRGIFIMDIWEGTPVFQVTYGENQMTGSVQTSREMKWCFPAGPSVISYPGRFVIYAADIYGQIWKVAHNPVDRGSEWQVDRIFTANPGSDQDSAMEALSIEPSLNASDSGRKLFHSPDVSYMGTDWTDDPVLYFVTGDRVHPRYIPPHDNRLYVVSDTGSPADETDLINLTCDELDGYADVNQDGLLEYGDALHNLDGLLQNRLLEVLFGVWDYPESGKRCRGWYRVLGRQGECPGATVSHRGEMGIGRPTIFYNTVYFTTFQPRLDDWCNPGGYRFLYTIDYAIGSAAGQENQDTDTNPDQQSRSVEDTSRVMETGGIPSDILMITRPEGTAAFICSGSSIIGLGREDGTMIGTSSHIPSLPGGIRRLMWRMD